MNAPMAAEPPLSYLALGDSYTIGESVPPALSWPAQLCEALSRRGVSIDPLEIIARTGWTTDELNAGIDAANPTREYQVVSLLIGVNNQYRGGDVESFSAEYRALLERAIGFAGGRVERVFVLSIPDWATTPFARRTDRELARESAGIEAYNDAKRSIAEARGVRYFDITPSTLAMADDAALVAEDGLHPSAEMYRIWVAQIAADVATMLTDD